MDIVQRSASCLVVRIYSISLLLLMIGCGSRDRLYQEEIALTESTWRTDDPLDFHFVVEDTSLLYHVFLYLRYEASYPYYNMYISYNLSHIQGPVIPKQRQELLLFDSQKGRPLGSGSSDLFFREDTLLRGHRFKLPGRYTLTLRQFMRIDSLAGIRNLGIRIDQVKKD